MITTIKLTPTQERGLRWVAGLSPSAHSAKGSRPTLKQYRRLVALKLVEQSNPDLPDAFAVHHTDYRLTDDGRAWLGAKGDRRDLTPAQINALAHFADEPASRVSDAKPTASSYARLVTLELLEVTNVWPYHRPTKAGWEWLGLKNGNCDSCKGTDIRHAADCPVELEAQAAKIEAEAPKSACSGCTKPLLFIHERWLGTDGSQTCIGLDSHSPTTVWRSPTAA